MIFIQLTYGLSNGYPSTILELCPFRGCPTRRFDNDLFITDVLAVVRIV
jgi:hypothetical protein